MDTNLYHLSIWQLILKFMGAFHGVIISCPTKVLLSLLKYLHPRHLYKRIHIPSPLALLIRCSFSEHRIYIYLYICYINPLTLLDWGLISEIQPSLAYFFVTYVRSALSLSEWLHVGDHTTQRHWVTNLCARTSPVGVHKTPANPI